MANTSTALNILVTAQTAMAQAKLKAVDAQLKKTAASSGLAGGSLGKMGKGGIAAAGGMAALVGAAAIAGKQLYDIGSEFDTAYDTIRVGTGKTGKALDQLKRDFKSVAGTVPDDLATTGTAIADLNVRLGLTRKPLRVMARDMLNLSRTTGTDLGNNIESVAVALNAWAVPMKDQGAALSGLYRLSQKSGASVADLATNMMKFSSPLRAAGFSMGEAAAMFASFQRAGVNVQTMLPGVKLALGNLAAPTDKLKKSLNALGIATDNPRKGFKQVMDLMGDKSSLNNMEKMQLAISVFGKRAQVDFTDAIKQGRFKLRDFIDEFKNGTDTIGKTTRETDDFSENMAKVWNRIKVAVEPAATAVFDFFGKVSAWLAGPKGQRAIKNLGTIFSTTFKIIGHAIGPVVTLFRTGFNVIRTVVKATNKFFSEDVQKAWNRVRSIYQSGVKWVKGKVNGLWGDIKGGVTAVRDGLTSVFSGAWSRVRAIFTDGKNAIVGVINSIIGVINKIPGVDIGLVGTSAGERSRLGAGSRRAAGEGLQRGGALFGGAPSGDSIPAMLERGEYVLNRKAVQAAGGPAALDRLNFKSAPRFQQGGPVGMNLGGAVNAVKGAASDLLGVGANAFIDLLPKPNIPAPLTGVGPYVIEQVTDWIKDRIASLAPSSGGSLPGFTGAPADFKDLGNNSWVDANTYAVATYLASRFGSTISSDYRSPAENAEAGGVPNSSHTRGTPSNPGAFDFVPANQGMADFAGKHIAGLSENMIHDVGSGLHNHIAFFRKGGLVGKIARMAKGGWVKKVGGHWDNDELASLAHAVGMARPGYMAQIANGESSGNPNVVGDDAAAGYGNTFGYGLWQITSGFHDDKIAAAGGAGTPGKGIFHPVKNALAAKAILDTEGINAWHADPRGPVGKVQSWLSRAIRASSGVGPKPAGMGKGGKGGKGNGGSPTEFVSGGVKPNQDFAGKKFTGLTALDKERAARRRKILDKISGKGAFFPGVGKYKANGRGINILGEQISIAEQSASAESGPGGSELTESELGEQVSLYTKLLEAQQQRRKMIAVAVAYLGRVRERMGLMVKESGKPGSKLKWKRGAFQTAYKSAGQTIKDLGTERTSLVGLTGKGGSIFDTRLKLDELGVATTSEGEKNSELLSLMREQLGIANRSLAISQAQMPIFQQFMPKYHTGGVVAGSGEVPIMAQAGEGVFTRDQMRAMGGAGNITVVIEDGAIDKNAIRVEVDGVLQQSVSKVRRSVGATR